MPSLQDVWLHFPPLEQNLLLQSELSVQGSFNPHSPLSLQAIIEMIVSLDLQVSVLALQFLHIMVPLMKLLL